MTIRRAVTGFALAASAVLAIFATLDGAGRFGPNSGDRFASVPDSARPLAEGREAAVARVASQGRSEAEPDRGAVRVAARDTQRARRPERDSGLRLASEASIGLAEPSPARSNQIQIESMDYSGRSLAMWSEPGSETTVIWVDDDAQGPATAPGVALIPVAPGASTRGTTMRAVSSHLDGEHQVEFPR